MSSSGNEYVPGFDNRATMVFDASSGRLPEPPVLAQDWEMLWNLIYERYDGGRQEGYVVVALDARGRVQRLGLLRPGTEEVPATLAVGRHTACGLHLIGDPRVALRQLLLAVSSAEAGDSPPLLEVTDLRSESGFVVAGVGPARTVLVRGAVNLEFASFRLLALPCAGAKRWPRPPERAWMEFFANPAVLVQPTLRRNPTAHREGAPGATLVSVVQPILAVDDVAGTSYRAAESLAPLRRAMLECDRRDSQWPRATAGRDAPPQQLELLFGRALEEPVEDYDDLQDDDRSNLVRVDAWGHTHRDGPTPCIRVVLAGPGGRVVLTLTDADLHRGVLIGRYARCAGRDAGHVFDDAVSRVHALLRSDPEGRILVLDAGSSNGVCVEGRGAMPCSVLRARQRVWLSPHSRLMYEEIQ